MPNPEEAKKQLVNALIDSKGARDYLINKMQKEIEEGLEKMFCPNGKPEQISFPLSQQNYENAFIRRNVA